tara:strand:+ start:38925 stop:40073 length:1149 start_codon:yes stop_codon:yes gene_type:complete
MELTINQSDKDPVLVVIQLTGGNDYLNTVIPHSNPLYHDYRPTVRITEEETLKIDSTIGFHPSMSPLFDLYNEDKVGIIHGVGYQNSPRSHFRSMDIWHTCEPDTLGTEGWLGRATRDLDPRKENVATAVSMGPNMFRALSSPGVPVACVEDLDSYGLMTNITDQIQRERIMERYKRLYSPALGSGPVMDFLGQTGLDALKGAEILSVAPSLYDSPIEYSDTTISKKLKGIAQIHLAGLGTRIFYADHGSFDSHSNQQGMLASLWKDLCIGIRDFFDDLERHNAADNVLMFLFSEFGRRTHDNGSGTDHGAAGAAFIIGKPVKGGQYGEYPSIELKDLEQGDPVPNTDFRSVYTSIIEDWMKLDAIPIVNGIFEKTDFFKVT